jgi:hypothetical protein
MSQRALICVEILFCLIIASVNAQGPTLDPLQTVNKATGEMGFSLPLAVVQGNNGHHAPINLNYQAGIGLRQISSNIGLGFSSLPGAISRQVVITPDDNERNYTTTCSINTILPWWAFVVSGILFIIGIIISIYTAQYEIIGAVVSLFFTLISFGINHITSEIAFGSKDYIAGGTHTPSLTTEDAKRPTGIMYDVKSADLPDIFRIYTPYISGEMYYEKNDGRFKMRQCGGSPLTYMETVNIDFDKSTKIFTITLADGTKLLFSQKVTGKPDQYTFSQEYPNDGSVELFATIHYKTHDPIIYAWCLTSVLFNDYVDANSNNTPDNGDVGSWIRYEYDETINENCRQLPFNQQTSTNAATIAFSGDRLHDVYLRKISTPIDSAVYKYKVGRLDDLWFPIDSINWEDITYDSESGPGSVKSNQRDANPYASDLTSVRSPHARPTARKVLDTIIVYNRLGGVVNKIKFHTDYALRPHTFSSYTKNQSAAFVAPNTANNPQAGTLTLQSMDFLNYENKRINQVIFTYSELNPDGCDVNKINDPPFPDHSLIRARYYVESKDLWGYYYPAETQNAFPWEVNKCEIPYAEAWSLKAVSFFNGLKIKWEYEENKYDKSNNLNCKHAIGDPRIGGGIRVKKVYAEDGMGKNLSWRYFYTCGSALEEKTDYDHDTSNSSGYVPVHPYDYIGDNDKDNPHDALDDYRTKLDLAKGGLYTPTKVSYEMVKIAKNYNEETKVAPEGYTVTEYTSTIDFPNGDQPAGLTTIAVSGLIDKSFLRGIPTVTSVFNSSGKLVAKNTREYNVIENPVVSMKEYPGAWVSLKKEKNYTNGVETEKEYQYAVQGGPDAVMAERQTKLPKFGSNKIEFYPGHTPREEYRINNCMGGCVAGNFYGANDKVDIVAGFGMNRPIYDKFYEYFLLISCKDVDFEESTTPDTWRANLIKFAGEPSGYSNKFIGGFTINFFNLNTIPDVILFENYNGKLSYEYFPDIQESRFTDPISTTDYSGTRVHHETDISADGLLIASAGITNLLSGISKDLVLVLYKPLEYYQIVVLSQIDENGQYQNIYKSSLIPDNTPNVDYPFYPGNTSNSGPGKTAIAAQLTHMDNSAPAVDIVLTKITDKPMVKKYFENIQISGTNLTFQTRNVRYPVGGVQNLLYPISTNAEFFPFYVPALIFPVPVTGFYDYHKPVYAVFYGGYGNSGSLTFRLMPFVIKTEPLYFDYDGQQNLITDKKYGLNIVTQSTPAWWDYPTMDTDAHLLTPISRANVYYELGRVSRMVTTWNHIGDKFYYPKANYIWKTNMTSAGVAGSPPPNFDFTTHSANDWSKWVLSDSIGRFNSNRNVVESFKPGFKSGSRMPTVTIFNKRGMATGQVVNAKFQECGVFTCDYDLDNANINGYFDEENGWAKHDEPSLPSGAICRIEKTFPHFGQKSLHVKNAKAAAHKVAVNSKTAKITWSAWVRPVDTKPIKFAASLISNGVGDNTVFYNYDYTTVKGLKADGTWQLVKFDIDISKPSAGSQPLPEDFGTVPNTDIAINNGIYTWIGNYTDGTAPATDFYIDDIRIYPKNAMVTTTYYDTLWFQPILSVDANNNPGNKVEYDNFGRTSRIYKTNAKNASTTLLKSIEYRAAGENISIISPVKKELCIIPGSIKIEWDYIKTGTQLRFYLSTDGGATWPDPSLPFATFTPVTAGRNSVVWTIPTSTLTSSICKIKIVDVSDEKATTISDEFTITKSAIIAPVASTRQASGSTLKIKWVLHNMVSVDIYYLASESATPDPIELVYPVLVSNPIEEYYWILPEIEDDNTGAKIRVVGRNALGVETVIESDPFTIESKSNFILKWDYKLKNYK